MRSADKLKALRAEAKKHGFTFRAINAHLNGVRAYHLFDRKSGARVGSMTTIGHEFDALQNGASDFSEYRSN
jgi:hypothetical protein